MSANICPENLLDEYIDDVVDLDADPSQPAEDEHEMPNFDAMEAKPVHETAEAELVPGEQGSPKGYIAYNPGVVEAPMNESPPHDPGNNYEYDSPAHQMFGSPPGNPMVGYADVGAPRSAPMATTGVPPVRTPIPTQPMNPDALPHHPVPYRPGPDAGQRPVPAMKTYPVLAQPGAPPAPAPARVAPVKDEPKKVNHEDLHNLQMAVQNDPTDKVARLAYVKGLAEAATQLTNDDPKGKNRERDHYNQEGKAMIKKLVSAGYTEAIFYLADCYGSGALGMNIDPREAFHLYQSAAKAGHSQAAYRVAVCCELGPEAGTRRDPTKSLQWYRRAASLGDVAATYKLGVVLLKGLLDQPRNPREALTWLQRAASLADAENPHALHELALLHENPGLRGMGGLVAADPLAACQLLHRAADLGYKFSQYRLGIAYENGLLGCPPDPRHAIIFYSRAAAQGEHHSELSLSGWYLTGVEGVLQQSDMEAYLWARKAAASGLAQAEYAMGYFAEVGIGGPSNLDDAKRWYWKASCMFCFG